MNRVLFTFKFIAQINSYDTKTKTKKKKTKTNTKIKKNKQKTETNRNKLISTDEHNKFLYDEPI